MDSALRYNRPVIWNGRPIRSWAAFHAIVKQPTRPLLAKLDDYSDAILVAGTTVTGVGACRPRELEHPDRGPPRRWTDRAIGASRRGPQTGHGEFSPFRERGRSGVSGTVTGDVLSTRWTGYDPCRRTAVGMAARTPLTLDP